MSLRLIGFLLTIAFVVPVLPATAETPLFISPMRVVIEDGERTAVVGVTNKSQRVRKYKIDIINQVMGKNGVTKLMDTFPYAAKRMLRYMPREIVLQPGQRQVVRLMVRRPRDLPPGDYHSHLLFEEDVVNPDAVEDGELGENQLEFKITTKLGMAIPVIVQNGEMTGALNATGFYIEPVGTKRRSLVVELERTGNSEASLFAMAERVLPNGDRLPVAKKRHLRFYREVDEGFIKMDIMRDMLDEPLDGNIELTLYDGKNEKAPIVQRLRLADQTPPAPDSLPISAPDNDAANNEAAENTAEDSADAEEAPAGN